MRRRPPVGVALDELIANPGKSRPEGGLYLPGSCERRNGGRRCPLLEFPRMAESVVALSDFGLRDACLERRRGSPCCDLEERCCGLTDFVRSMRLLIEQERRGRC